MKVTGRLQFDRLSQYSFPIEWLLVQNRIYGVLFDQIVGFRSDVVQRFPSTSDKAKELYYSAEIFKATTYAILICATFRCAALLQSRAAMRTIMVGSCYSAMVSSTVR